MSVPNPYFIYIVLKWPNGNRPTPNEIARVRAYDVYGGTETLEGECGYDSSTGGWMPVFMQKISVFAGREKPNLKLQVWSTAEQVVHTTQIFNAIECGSTVTIIIGQGDSSDTTTWVVSGRVTKSDGSPVTAGTVKAMDVTLGSTAYLGVSALDQNGNYSISYATAAFNNNGAEHANPNLQVQAFDAAGTPLAISDIITGASQSQAIDLRVTSNPMPGERLVYGSIQNPIALPVDNVRVRAYHVAWGSDGAIREVLLGSATSTRGGGYAIYYQAPIIPPASSPESQINLEVKAVTPDAADDPLDDVILAVQGIFFDAPASQVVDLIVDKTASFNDSEYQRLDTALSAHFGSRRSATLDQMRAMPAFVPFVAQTIGWDVFYVQAYLDTDTIVQAVERLVHLPDPQPVSPQPNRPTVSNRTHFIYGLIRMGLGSTLATLIDAGSDRAYDAIIEAIHASIVSRDVEFDLKNVIGYWCDVMAEAMATGASTSNSGLWQQYLLTLALGTSPSGIDKHKAVVNALTQWSGSFAELCQDLAGKGTITQSEADSLQFLFELNHALDDFLPLVKSIQQSNGSPPRWKTIADLATIPELPRANERSWYDIAMAMDLPVANTKRIYPGNVPGANDDEKCRVIAGRMYEMFGGIGPQERFRAEMNKEIAAAPPTSPVPEWLRNIATFLDTHLDFSLGETNFDAYAVDHTLSLSETDIAHLKAFQRIFRLTPLYQAVRTLVDDELDAAFKIAQLDEDIFILDYQKVVGGLTGARRIHRLAAQVSGELLLTSVKYNTDLGSVGGATAISNTVQLSAFTTAAASATGGSVMHYPDWRTLFGGMNQCACKDCQTVFSPGAYMVDLLQFVDKRLRRNIFTRRPDLADLEISCPNTNRMLPYIDLVNEILESVIAPYTFDLTYSDGSTTIPVTKAELDASCDPAQVSDQIRGIFEASKFVLSRACTLRPSADNRADEYVLEDEGWRFAIRHVANAAAYTVVPLCQTSATNDSLEVFPEHHNQTAYDFLETAVFPFNLPLALGKEESALFLRQKKVGWHEILRAFDKRLTSEKLQQGVGTLQYLQLTPSESAAILCQLAGVPAPAYWGFAAMSTTWVSELQKVGTFLERARITYKQMLDLIDTRFVHNPAGLPLELSVDSDDDAVDCQYQNFNIENLDETALIRISFFLRLWRRIGWSMRDLDCYLTNIERSNPTQSDIPPDLEILSLVKQLSDELKLAPRAIIAWWSAIDTRRTERAPKSLFDDIFLVGPKNQPERVVMERIAQGEKVTVDPQNQEPGQDILAYLRAGLGVRARDMESLWNYVMYGRLDPVPPAEQTPVDLDLDLVTMMYRAATVGSALKVSIREILEMRSMLGTWPFPDTAIDNRDVMRTTVVQTWDYLDRIRRLRATKFTVPEIAYLLQHLTQPYLGPSADDYDEAVRKALAASAAIATAFPEVPTPDAVALAGLLAKLVPAEQASGLVRVIAGPAQLDDPDYRKTRDRFGFAMETVGLTLADYVTYSETRPAAARYAQAYPKVRATVVERSRTESIIALAAELGGVDKDAADLLLSRGLPSLTAPATPLVPAIADWKSLLLGGWVDTSTAANLPVIQDALPGAWRTTLVIPKDGNQRFYAVLASPTAVTPGPCPVVLTLDGVPLTPSLVPPPPDSPATTKLAKYIFEPSTDAGAYKAGALLQIHLEFQTGSPWNLLTLAWADNGEDPTTVPVTVTIPWHRGPGSAGGPSFANLPDHYLQLVKAAEMVKGLKLTRRELQHLVGDSDRVKLLGGLPLNAGADPVSWDVLSSQLDLLDLARSLPFKKGSFFDVLENPNDFATGDLATLLDWRAEDIETVRTAYDTTPTAWSDTGLWYMLRACLSIVARLDLRAAQILDLLVTDDPDLPAAMILRSTYRSRFSKDAWKDAFKAPSDGLRQKKRDALVGYLLHVGDKGVTFKDENDLYSHYLIDVEMEPDTLISRLKLALNAIQLYVQRVFWGLEGKVEFTDVDKARSQWEWMKNYRVWEANRKVFLYPENWIEPELRDDKSPFFKELEEELSQGEITNEKGRQALTHYLEKIAEVSNVLVVGSFVQPINKDGVAYMMHVVARARTQSRTFFQRTYTAKQNGSGSWSPWKKIDLEIKADVVAPVVFNSRLHLYWLVVTTKQQSKELPAGRFVDGHDATEERAQYVSQIQLMSTEYQATLDKWSKPRVTKSKAMDYDVQKPSDRPMGEDEPQSDCYNLWVDRPSNELLSISLLKTTAPSGGSLPIKQLGVFKIYASGHERFEGTTKNLALGASWPVGTQLKSNRAEECGAAVDNETAADAYRLKGSVEFLRRTPDSFSVFNANFGYIEGSEAAPSFFDTQSKSLLVVNGPDRALSGMKKVRTPVAAFQTFNHPLARELQGLLQNFGPPGIMNRLTQALPASENYYYNYSYGRSSYYYNYYGSVYLGYHIAGDTMAWGSGQRKFELEHLPNRNTVLRPYPLPTVEFAQGTPMGQYNWELFFHVPMTVAARLSSDLKFEEAMNWFHYVFDPRQDFNDYEKTKEWAYHLPPGARFWNFLPFFANRDATKSLRDSLNATPETSADAYRRREYEALVEEWRENPFNPHLIARHRMVAYQKNVVMKYLDNIIAWADWLFRQDAWEPINEATQLYVLASEILGKRPEIIEPIEKERCLSYSELRGIGLDAFSEALADTEYVLVKSPAYLKSCEVAPPRPGAEHINGMMAQSAYFAIPRNPKLDTYWDIVADRLFKIRNSMNIDGVKRQLALFEPPIDPALLVRARAAGVDLSSVLSQANASLPYYRFSVWMQKALDLCNEVRSFGGAVLAALEKKDAEALQLLRQTHEIKMLQLTRKVRETQLKEAEANIEALDRSRALAEERYEEYRNRERISGDERDQVSKTNIAKWAEVTQAGLHGVAAIFTAVPDSKAGCVGPFPLFNLDLKIGGALVNAANLAASVAGAVASYTRGEATLSGLNASFARRWEDWKLQERLAALEMKQIDQQIVAATIRRDIAQLEIDNLDVQIDHANEVQDFLKDKFTNRDLYQWMVSQLSRTFQQVYRLAFDAAKTAEHAYQFELGSDANFVQFGYVDSLRQGLLTGEKLVADLKRMEVAHLQNNKREYEVTKSISLSMIDGEALQKLRTGGKCTFELSETLFDLDFPGQYFRRIKAVRVSIPCVTGPHTSVSATLTLLNSAMRKVATGATDASDYSWTGYDDARFVQDLTGVQAIATSTGQSDGGLFELNFRDERYLPFEGSGVISRWRLELPNAEGVGADRWQFDYSTISDVVLHISYTSREGGEALKAAANASIADKLTSLRQAFDTAEGKLAMAISLKQDFPDLLRSLADPTTISVSLALPPEAFPFILRGRIASASLEPTDVALYKKPQGGTYEGDNSVLTIKDESDDDVSALPLVGSEWKLMVPSGSSLANVDDIVLVISYALSTS